VEGKIVLKLDELNQRQIFLDAYEILIGDERMGRTFNGVIDRVISGESLKASRIARFSLR
jgi:hypothetical protein